MKSSGQKKFLAFNSPDISDLEINAVVDVLKSGWLGNGHVAREFETEFSNYGGKHCVAVNSCSMGLFLALKCENISFWDHVITTPLTFAATANSILMAGGTPRFVDVDETGCLNPDLLEKEITGNTRFIVPVNMYGHKCRMDKIMQIARKYDLKVIEDCAHSFPLPVSGDWGVYSFYPTKNITAGDGGMVVCPNKKSAERLRVMAAQGLSLDAWDRYGSGPIKNYVVVSEGVKGSMNDLNASLGLAQLRRWPDLRAKRDKVWNIYEKALGSKPRPHSRHIYTVETPNRTEMREFLYKEGIGTGVHYNPLHLEPAFQFLHYKKGSFPVAERIGREAVSLPLSSNMTEDDAHRVVNAVLKFKGE